MSYAWAKVHIEILDDHKMGILPDALWRRVIELILLAKKLDKGGWLPGMMEMSWVLRISAERLEADLEELSKSGIVELKEGNWFLTNFAKRQGKESDAERMRNYRSRRTVTNDSDVSVTQRNTDLRLDKTRQDETDIGAPAPASPRDQLRFNLTPEGALMAQKLRAVCESKGRRATEFYANALQRDAYLTVFSALGGNLERLLDSAMKKDITERGKLLAWLEGCAKKNGKDKPHGESRDIPNEPAYTADDYASAERINAASAKRRAAIEAKRVQV